MRAGCYLRSDARLCPPGLQVRARYHRVHGQTPRRGLSRSVEAREPMIRPMVTVLWRTLAVVSRAGADRRGPARAADRTVPAGVGLGREPGWPRLERWILAHPKHGPVIRRWRERGAVPRRAKWFASGMMVVSAAVFAATPAPPWAKVALPMFMLTVAVWLWRRPEE